MKSLGRFVRGNSCRESLQGNFGNTDLRGRSGDAALQGHSGSTLWQDLLTFMPQARSHRAFSLVELMIVVAIIGVLTAIAIPNFQAFQARSRQSEAKAALTSIYTAEQTFHSRWEVYAAGFKTIGYTPSGEYRYAAGFDDGLSNGKNLCGLATGADTATASTTDTVGCGPAPGKIFEVVATTNKITDKNWNTETNCLAAAGDNKDECFYIGVSGWDDKLDDSGNTTAISATTFLAAAVGNPFSKTDCKADTSVDSKCDVWSIDENKDLEHDNEQEE